MKKILFALFVHSLLLTSCESFLEMPKEHEPSSGSYFKTAEEFEQLVVGAYQPLRAVYGRNNFVCGEMRSDNTHYEYYIKQGGQEHGDREAICNFMDGEENWYSNGLFNDSYNGIAKTNVIISRMHDGIPEPTRSTAVAEARFLRALYYYNLVRFFGEVPLHDKEVVSSGGATKPKSPVAEIFNLIRMDLEEAIRVLPEVKAFPQSGRATKGAAQTLLASAYLYQKQYSEALALLNQVASQGYGLLNRYADVFKIENKNSKESIFEIQFKEGTEGQHSMYLYYFLPKSSDNSAIINIANSNTYESGGCNVPTMDLLHSYEKGDNRLEASIAVVEGEMDGDNFISKRLVSPVDYQPANDTPYRYMCNKYNNPHSVYRETADNWPVFRYADVLLMIAECLNETGKSPEALPYINLVRNRAGLAPLTETNQQKLRTLILQERRIELAFENHRWHDLVRTGNAVTTMNVHGKEMKAAYPYLSPNAYQVTEARLVFPIPFRETVWNPNL